MSNDISVVIPTITGREAWLAACIEEYERTAPGAEIIVVKDEPSCGIAWEKGYEQSTRPYVHFTADDLLPRDRWWVEATQFAHAGIVPAANVRDVYDRPAHCNSPLGDMGLHPNVLVPFLSREMLERGGWMTTVHYGSDDWITYRAVQLGYEVRRGITYCFTHCVAGEGRNYLRRYGDVKRLADDMLAAGYLPPVYAQLEVNLRASPTGLDSVKIDDLDSQVRKQLRAQQGLA